MDLKRNISTYLQAAFYVFAGINHFVNPSFYEGLIPSYLPFHDAINFASGGFEILFGAALVSSKTKKIASFGIIAMLVAFIPSHVYFIQIGGCIADGLCAPLWVGWVRLIVIHPLLIWWAWTSRK